MLASAQIKIYFRTVGPGNAMCALSQRLYSVLLLAVHYNIIAGQLRILVTLRKYVKHRHNATSHPTKLNSVHCLRTAHPTFEAIISRFAPTVPQHMA
jgi:hypothetical protein